jgi:hypothetical protein
VCTYDRIPIRFCGHACHRLRLVQGSGHSCGYWGSVGVIKCWLFLTTMIACFPATAPWQGPAAPPPGTLTVGLWGSLLGLTGHLSADDVLGDDGRCLSNAA